MRADHFRSRRSLDQTEWPIRSRLQRTKELWLDPTFQPPPSFVAELRAAAAEFRHNARAAPHSDYFKHNLDLARWLYPI